MNVETTVAHNRYRKLSILLGILGMCLLAVIIGLIASSRLNDDKQVMKNNLRPVPLPKFSKIWLYCRHICARDTLKQVSRLFRTFLKILIFRIFSVSLCVKSGRRLGTAKFWTLYFAFQIENQKNQNHFVMLDSHR